MLMTVGGGCLTLLIATPCEGPIAFLLYLIIWWIGNLVNDVWHKFIPSKVSLFVWRLLRNRLLTKDNLLRRSIIQYNDIMWVADCGTSETATHLFLGCRISTSVWYHVLNWLGTLSVAPGVLRDHCIQFSNMAGIPRTIHKYFKVVRFAFVWIIWKERNNRIFNNTVSDPSILADKVKLNSYLWLKSKQVLFHYSYHDWWKHPLLCMGVHV